MESWEEKYKKLKAEKIPPKRLEPEPLLRKALRGIKKGRAIDVGCGLGEDTHELSSNGWKIIGIDTSRKAVNLAKTLFPKKTKFEHASATQLPATNRSLDLVYDKECFVNLSSKDQKQYKNEIFRVLKPNGHYCIIFFEEPLVPKVQKVLRRMKKQKVWTRPNIEKFFGPKYTFKRTSSREAIVNKEKKVMTALLLEKL
ncbi:class I SAM-dependent methyltransferase [Candidatus Woesearchaeota archaeon]|nr:class I SAM-dependent methyltransferase [Candidatus Woesearchaeota archaeon]